VVAAHYEQIPIYARVGSIIPVGPEIQYAGEKPGAPITLFVYGGDDGSFTLYEDEGVNYNYERGDFSTIPFSYSEAKRRLVIGERAGTYEGMPMERIFNVVLVDQDHPSPLEYDATNQQSVNYEGYEITINF
jgi:alpha-D-xyloside xylohydrolase